MRSLAAVLLLCASAWAAGPPPLSCPATIAVPGQPARAFERISIYNGKPGGQEYDLAPDDQTEAGRKITQTWFLKDYREMPIFLRCRYRGTDAVKILDVPAAYQKCVFQFELDSKNAITGTSQFSCR